ncbi:putative BKI1/putative membrane-associated kinase regulator/4 [Helianthus debilis subsp. tardiflorus]
MDVNSFLGSVCYDDIEEEEYIDMEVSAYSNPFHHLNSSEFEFQMFSSSSDRELITTSPADELFYKGNLLPLHFPPRLQMVEKILQDQNNDAFDEFFGTPLATSPYATPNSNTPFRSCNISPSGSCQVSRELNPDDYFLDNTSENPKKSWTKKLNLTKQSSLGWSKLKSFFGKSGCSDGSRSKFPRTSGKKKEKLNVSGAMTTSKRFCYTNTSSGPSPFTNSSHSNSSSELQVHHRSINMSSEIESEINSAIAHCKRSQQQMHTIHKTINDMGFSSLAV